MSTLDAFGFGCIGGFLAYVVSFALPLFRDMWKSGKFEATLPRIIAAIGIMAGLVALGGAAAWAFGTEGMSNRDAFFYGVAGEGLLAGAIRSVT